MFIGKFSFIILFKYCCFSQRKLKKERKKDGVHLWPAGDSNVEDDGGVKGPASFLLRLEHLI